MKTITIHTTPIYLAIIIAFSILLAFSFAYTLVGFVNFNEYCTWNIINWEKECYPTKGYMIDWLGGFLISSVFSFIWFGFLFYWANRNKKWVRVRWVD